MKSSLLVLLVLSCLAFNSSADLTHLTLTRKKVSASRVFSHHGRPWAAGSKARFPIKLFTESKLPAQEMKGGVVPVGEYYLTLLFGGQPINVQIDTGSSTMAVPLLQCVNCHPDDHRFDISSARGSAGLISCESQTCRPNSCRAMSQCTKCSSTQACCSSVVPKACGFFLAYADESGAAGALAEAMVGIGGITVPLAFGTILRETNDFEAENVDGIFGMAYKALACNPTCVLPLFDTLVASGKVDRDIFSICTGTNGGTLVLGGSNPNLYKGQLQYVPMVHQGIKLFYGVNIQGMNVNGERLILPSFSKGIVDSGTTVLVVTTSTYGKLRSYFQSNFCNVPGLCPGKANGYSRQSWEADVVHQDDIDMVRRHGNSTERTIAETWFYPGYCAQLSDEYIAMLPTLTIVLDNDVTLELDPETYMLRCLGISPLDNLEQMGNNVILGDTVLQKYYVEYDRENDRVGFAEAGNCHDPNAFAPALAHASPGILLNSCVDFHPSSLRSGRVQATKAERIYEYLVQSVRLQTIRSAKQWKEV
ncbi:aspartyl protease [Gracilaria domingensis]|nr:aspartyl protease [Gracilaria domingensis]